MGLTINRKQDQRTVHACTHNVADIPNGVTVVSAELVAGGILREGTPLGKDTAGLYHVVKTAKLTENASNSATTYNVEKGHHFKVGDFIMVKPGAKAYAITAIDTTTNATHDVITVGTTLGVAVSKGGALVQALAESASTSSKFKYAPKAYAGDSYDVEALTNHFVAAVTIGQFKESVIPAISDEIKAATPTVVFI